MYKNLHMFGFLLILAVAGLPVKAQPALTGRIDSVMRLANQRGIFNGNILVARKGKVIYQGSFGYADGSKSRKLTPELIFDIGSISKEFNGTGIMILKERGLLSLDDPIARFFPDLPGWAQKVKVRHLINYTSGIPLFDPLAGETDQDIWRNLTGLTDLKFEPGVAYIYNHYNVYLQMRIIEKVSGMSYAGFIRKNILVPSKMRDARIDYPANGKAMARAFNSEYQETPYAQGMTGWVRLPIRDLYRWTQCLDNYQLISKASYQELAANFPGGESSLGATGFAGGELEWHQHQGSNSNYEALFYDNVKEGVTIVMMTNNQQLKVHGIKFALLEVLNGAAAVTVPKKSVYLEVREKVLADIEKGLAYYNDLKTNRQDQYDFAFEIGDLISTGKYLERRSKYDDAIRVFQLAIQLDAKPADISYAYELIGLCYSKKNEKQSAIIHYQKALDIDPKNKNAEGMLATLKEK